MARENLVDRLLLRLIEIELGCEPVKERMRVGRNAVMPMALLPLAQNPARYTGDEHQHEQERSPHGHRHCHLLLPRASSNSRLRLGGRLPVAIVRPTASEGASTRVHCSWMSMSPGTSPVARKRIARAPTKRAIATAAAREPASHCRTDPGRFTASAVTRDANASQCCASS